MTVKDVVAVMDETLSIYEELTKLSHEKKDAVIANDVDSINQTVRQELKLSKQLEQLEQRRAEAVVQLLRSKGYATAADINVSGLIRMIVQSEDKKTLAAAQQRLQEALDHFRDIHETNQQLLVNALQFVDFSLDLFMAAEDDSTYANPQTNAQRSSYNKMFDAKA